MAHARKELSLCLEQRVQSTRHLPSLRKNLKKYLLKYAYSVDIVHI